jgi:hypothetical protein
MAPFRSVRQYGSMAGLDDFPVITRRQLIIGGKMTTDAMDAIKAGPSDGFLWEGEVSGFGVRGHGPRVYAAIHPGTATNFRVGGWLVMSWSQPVRCRTSSLSSPKWS